MTYLTKEDIYAGAVIEIQRNANFEGIARLLEPDGEILSFIEGEESPVILKQRWLVEWATLDECSDMLSGQGDRITQTGLAGKRCHRHIEFYGGPSWESYSFKHGGLEERNYDNTSKPTDDFNGLF